MKEKKKKVVVALSGGIDSSVAALLLKRAGFDLVAFFMKFWSEGNSKDGSNKCCSLESEKRAREVAAKLKIPFYVLNLEKEFKKRIVDYFLRESKRGLTPNPCVVCNKEIKFGLLLEKALELDADFIATGHYARKKKTENGKKKIEYRLLKARDKNKDQSYFLWKLNQEQLKYILFPVGNYLRAEVEKMARDFKLPTAGIPKSQEICFVKKTVNDFLKKYLKENPGPVVLQKDDGKKKIIVRHKGLWFYTIGQRKGINLSGGPYYVKEKDLKRNILFITKNEKDLLKKELVARDIGWISGEEPKLPLNIQAKIRYRHQAVKSTITKILNSKFYILKFARPQRAITPGQSVVFYKGEDLLGGGVTV